jgi:rare lipoprotein A
MAGCAKRHTAHAPVTHVPAAVPAVPPKSGETGLASWYGHPYDGRQAANGEIYDMETLVAAHRTLRFGTWVRVTNLGNAKTVDVRIIDRGPFVDGRIIDLSHAAAEKIDLIGPGVARVRLDILSAPPVAPAAATFYAVQVGAFADRARAEQVRSTLQRRYGTARLVVRQGSPQLWRVLVGRETSEEGAQQLEQRLRGEADHCFVVRLDDVSTAAGR